MLTPRKSARRSPGCEQLPDGTLSRAGVAWMSSTSRAAVSSSVPGQDRSGLVRKSVSRQPPGTLRNEEQENKEQHGRNDSNPEHAPPHLGDNDPVEESALRRERTGPGEEQAHSKNTPQESPG